MGIDVNPPISNNRSNQIDTSNVERKKHILINYM